MGKHSPRKLYLLLAAWTFLAVAAVGAVTVVLRMETVRSQAEDDAAAMVSRTLLLVLEREAGDLTEASLSSYETLARSLVSDQVRAIRLWHSGGRLLAATDDGSAATLNRGALARAAEGETPIFKTNSGGETVLASYARLGSGAVVEVQQDYGPIADSIAKSRWFVILVTIGGGLALLALVQTIAWAATRGLRSEYNRLLHLYRTGQALRSTLDVADVLERLARDAADYTRAQVGLVVLVDEKSKELVLKATYNREANSSAQHRRAVDEWFLLRCLATGQTEVVEQDRPPFDPMLAAELSLHGLVFILCVPISNHEGVIGVLMVMRRRSQGKFAASDAQVLEEMAAQAAMAVEQASLFAKVRTYADDLELSYDSTLKVLMAALDTKDAVTQGHSERVSQLTVALAKELRVPQERLLDIERGALLHDVGKIGVPDEVLRKPASLNEQEWEAMQKHPMLAGLMVSKVKFLEGALPILLYHHERYDGTGYPFGLKSDAIPLEARIFTVVDSFDAMTSDRPYRQATSTQEALAEIQRNAGIQFDPKVVEAFTRVVAHMQPISEEAA